MRLVCPVIGIIILYRLKEYPQDFFTVRLFFPYIINMYFVERYIEFYKNLTCQTWNLIIYNNLHRYGLTVLDLVIGL